MSKRAWLAIGAGLATFVAFYVFVSLLASDKMIVGVVWQLAIILGVAGVFSFFMWRSLRRR